MIESGKFAVKSLVQTDDYNTLSILDAIKKIEPKKENQKTV